MHNARGAQCDDTGFRYLLAATNRHVVNLAEQIGKIENIYLQHAHHSTTNTKQHFHDRARPAKLIDWSIDDDNDPRRART